ncbi:MULTISPECIES: hypothetical protein [Moorena]|nr:MULTISPECIES: hypothetical protein [Moorena]
MVSIQLSAISATGTLLEVLSALGLWPRYTEQFMPIAHATRPACA